ncbi:hypothetical protein M0805_005845 [Coniferiporia weirii]|nr:hypothetical protein M0805_005845 [Coniferiporia weirii]
MPAGNDTNFGTVGAAGNEAILLSVFPSQNTLMGALLVGCYFAVSLWGLISHQMYRYYRMYGDDSLITKIMVGVMWLLDTLHSILIMHTCYYYLVSNYFNPFTLLNGVWCVISPPAPIGAVLTAITIVSYKEVSFIKFEGFTWLVCLTLGFGIVCDIMITGSLYWFLKRSKTGFGITDSIIDKFLLYSVNTGLLTVVYSTAVLICAALMEANLIYVGMFFVISKLYTNSLLAVLNSRKGLPRNSDHGSFDVKGMRHIAAWDVNELRSSPRHRVRTS